MVNQRYKELLYTLRADERTEVMKTIELAKLLYHAVQAI